MFEQVDSYNLYGNAYTLPAFLLSVLIHGVLFFSLIYNAHREEPRNQKIFMVEMIPQKLPSLPPQKINQQTLPLPAQKGVQKKAAPKQPEIPLPSKRQFVSPPDAGLHQKPKKNTRFLSDADSYAEKEQIHRGDGIDAGSKLGDGKFGNNIQNKTQTKNTNLKPPVSQKILPPGGRAAPANGGSGTVSKNPLLNIPSKAGTSVQKPTGSSRVRNPNAPLDLRPDYSLLNEFSKENNSKSRTSAGQSFDPTPFSRSAGSGARFIGLNGSSDFIPGVSDGDITLLNAKADQFAVFVRRVATQVFYQLKRQGWTLLSGADIRQMNDEAVFRAKLSPAGKLINVEFLQKSGSMHFDQVLFDSIKASVSDPHPPAEAVASDGTIRFIFMAKAWSRMGLGPNGAPSENRWLLLKTGLE